VISGGTLPDDGGYARIEGKAYRLLGGDSSVGWFARLPYPDIVDTGMMLVTYNHLAGGSGSYATIPSYVISDTQDGTYGQVYIVEDGYTPLPPAPFVLFEEASTAPVGTVRLVTSSGYSLHEVLSYSVDEGSFDDGNARGKVYLKAGTA